MSDGSGSLPKRARAALGAFLRRLGLARGQTLVASPVKGEVFAAPSPAASGPFDLAGDNWNRPGDIPIAAVWGVPKARRELVTALLSDHRVAYARSTKAWPRQKAMLDHCTPLAIVVWGMAEPPEVAEYAAGRQIPIHRIADGFIGLLRRDTGGAALSLVFDRQGLYFDDSRPSELEMVLATCDFRGDPTLLEVATHCIGEIRAHGLTKHAALPTDKAALLYGPKVRPRILVMGHVERRKPVPYGSGNVMTNVDLVRLAAAEHPGAQILYRPHPDILSGSRKTVSDPADMAHLAEILTTPMSLGDALHQVDRVYTFDSLGGFEALMHAIPVTTLGAPFYSGWSLTDDRRSTGRRNRALSLEEVFAGAYLLHAKYFDPDTHEPADLPTALARLKADRSAWAADCAPESVMSRMEAYDLATRKRCDPREISKSGAGSIVIVTDTPSALPVARAMAGKGKKVTLLCTKDAVANSQDFTLSPGEGRNLVVSSMHKQYGIPLSRTEAQSVELAATFSTELGGALGKVLAGHVPDPLITAFGEGLQNFMYHEALRFHVARSCVVEFDAALLIFQETEAHLDVIKSFLYHGNLERRSGGITYSPANAESASLEDLLDERVAAFEPTDHEKLNGEFGALWRSLRDHASNRCSAIGGHIAVCGDLFKDAYAPATWKLIEVLARHSPQSVLIHSSEFLSLASQDDARTIIFDRNLSGSCMLYDGCLRRYKERYPPAVFEQSVLLSKGVFGLMQESIGLRLPQRLIEVIRPRVLKYLDGLFTHLICAAEAMQLMERCTLVATSMERTLSSRILCAVARAKGVPTIGIQPQVMSGSPRYLPPVVDRMGVIDTSQLEVHRKLGGRAGTLEPIGSMHYLEGLKRLESASAHLRAPADRRTVLFAMQHSNSSQMIATALALKAMAARNGLRVVVKPHPRQELPVLHAILDIFAGDPNASVLPQRSDTYAAAAQSRMVVGLFSTVLIECALGGKPVVVAAFDDIHPSVDFSLLGLALKAGDAKVLEEHILDICEDGPLAQRLASSRQEFLSRNPQFMRPYTSACLESFVTSALEQAPPARGHGLSLVQSREKAG